jgi:hypothetical protein
MPNWKKIITSGSDAQLNSLQVSGSLSVTGSISSLQTFQSGVVSGSQFTGNPKTITINLLQNLPNNNYSITVTGEIARTWSIISGSRTTSSFGINANANNAFTENVYWQLIKY